MLGVSAMLGGDGGGGAAEGRDSGCGGGGGDAAGVAGTSSGGFSEEDKLRMEESDRNSGGNRWPRQETLALLKIRSEMDVAFRDSSLKGPLWDEVSRKLAELGYQRSSKKCKEKFENVYKYHRRTKEGRSSKSDGKTYRFFDQLEALENQAPAAPSLPPPPLPPPLRPQSQPVTSATPVAVAMPATTHPATHPPVVTHVFTVPSMSSLNPTAIVSQSPISINPPPSLPPPVVASPISFSYQTAINQPSHIKIPDVGSISTSSSTSSDEEAERRGRRKRKWGDFFQRLMSEVIEKQEEMQKKFLETLDRRERERVAREEAWRAQEMARMNREHELLVHERSVAAAKDAAVIQFLQKISDGQQPIPNAPQMQTQVQMQMPESNPAPPQPQQPTPQPPTQPQPPAAPRQAVLHPPLQQQVLQPTPAPQPLQLQVQTPVKGMEIMKADNGGGGGGGEGYTPTSSSRWPKAEVEALIRLRTNMDTKYQENVPKGPLWEEISAAMRRIGYDRNAKRCKEKWENINKYFKKVKESNKKRPEDSKTCPYFQQLDELYKEKAKNENNTTNISPQNFNVGSNAFSMKPAESVPGVAPIMVQPEQQYRPNEDDDSQNMEGDDGEEEEDDEDEDEAGGYEVVPNKAASNSVGTTA